MKLREFLASVSEESSLKRKKIFSFRRVKLYFVNRREAARWKAVMAQIRKMDAQLAEVKALAREKGVCRAN